MEHISENQKVLLICNTTEASLADIKENFGKIKADITYQSPQNVLFNKELSASSFDCILSGYKSEAINYTADLLATILNLLKPGSKFIAYVTSMETSSDLEFDLRVNGFVDISSSNLAIHGFKPKYEVGSSTKLSFAKKAAAPAVWKLDDDDDETIDPNILLDEEDLKKPDPSSLRVCGTTGKRKACKDCSCGLAEELNGEKNGTAVDTSAGPKSSCGSCYLGDAFRCAECPYLGMPAFKPGEKIQLSDNQLKADV